MSETRKIDDILDECLERLLVKGEALEQCLQRFPEHSGSLRPLLETVLATRQVATIQPGAEFRDRARYQFQAALQEMGQKRSRSSFNWGWQPRWATAVAIVLAVFLAGGGTVAAASGSMPDNPLYAVKLATEQVQLAVTFSKLGKAELHTKLADKRVMEIVYLADKDRPGKIALATDSLNTHLTEIATLVSAQGVTRGVVMAPVVEVEEAAVAEGTPVTIAMPGPAEAGEAGKERAAEEAAVVAEVPAPEIEVAAEEGLLPGQASERGKEASLKADRRAKLKTKVGLQSSNNIARLRALLDTAPESARPALLRAIAVSEAGYEKALESLERP